MSFIIYDIVFFALSLLAVGIFFYKKRKNFSIEGPLYLYRTKFGLNLIDRLSKKYSKVLKPLQYLIIFCGYALMIFGMWFIIKIAYFYLTSPVLAKALKVPVIFPLLPYLPEIFKLDFLPPFYFTYWIIIIALIALPHEFAHGIYARFFKIKVHSTGFGFLRLFKIPLPFLAAFVEPAEKQMEKKKITPQLAVIAAGTFANIIVAILFVLLMWLFVIAAFTPAGVYFNTYATKPVFIEDINLINNISLVDSNNLNQIIKSSPEISTIETLNEKLIARSAIYDKGEIIGFEVYENSPAFKSNLSGAIQEINGENIKSYDNLRETLGKYRPGDNITIITIKGKEKMNYEITLGDREGRAFLGVGVIPQRSSGILGLFYTVAVKIKDPAIYYESNIGDFGIFIYELLWWIIIVSFSVALMNMLPLGIFDGGRFFLLTIWGITKRKDIGEKAFKIVTALMLALLAVLMLKWFSILF
ncbi:site-2 protease family protein [Candidatus Pacearchaeota archaeon]|nr:site-2 protease family protein [Candidatus Pacearchaeota archaeon]